MPQSNTRETILKAASHIVQSDGILELTLEATAKLAGISKGGLLYHFPSKEDLIKGMVSHLIQSYIDNIKKGAEQDTLDKGKWTRSFIKETFNQGSSNQEMNAGLLAAVAYNPELLKPIQEAYSEWEMKIEDDGLDKTNATILRLAVDGLWFSELFGLAPLSDDLRENVFNKLIQFTKEV
ncbi:MAG: TetR/AcrR family transcriptional regulator [Firmicutes bacterium]|nr:TetR/AcrR family transcriptional regulator [Bacillota bacterium]